jgi:predicted ATP-grasp superfamily ATP-dependent carboligase
MTKTVLLTIGRLPKALDFARSFAGAGWRVIVAEPFKSHLTGASNAVAKSIMTPPPSAGKQAYLKAISDIVTQESVDLVLPLSEETIHVAHLVSRAHLFAPPPDRLLELHDKERFIELAQSLGMSVPMTARLGTTQAQDLTESCDYVIKPVFSCSGRGVSLHKRGSILPRVIDTHMNERAIVQAQVKGQQFSTFALAHHGRVQTNVVYRGTIMTGTVSVAFERVEQVQIDQWVSDFVAKTGYSGFISFDFFVGDDGVPQAIECNPRVTSGVHFIQTADLAPAILAPFSQPIRLKAQTRMMQFYPTLTEVQASMFGSRFIGNVKTMRTSADVTWDKADPMPFITMPITAFTIIAKSIRQQQTFGQVSTQDISWFEDDRLVSLRS